VVKSVKVVSAKFAIFVILWFSVQTCFAQIARLVDNEKLAFKVIVRARAR
jgi:hypothetical protein